MLAAGALGGLALVQTSSAAASGPVAGRQGEPWLALTPESPLEPDLPIIDSHHHYWPNSADFAPYAHYMTPELAHDMAGHNVRATVFVQASVMYRQDGPPEMRPVGEVESVEAMAGEVEREDAPCRQSAAIVGWADLMLGGGVEPVLQAMRAASPRRFRGVRYSVTWDPHPVSWDGQPVAANRGPPGLLATPEFRAGAGVLSRLGLSLDTQVSPAQMAELATFARSMPDLTIILDHLGGLTRVGAYAGRDDEVLPAWREGIKAAAQAPNIVLKLGGLGMPRTGYGWEQRAKPVGSEELAGQMAPLLDHAIQQFGPDRCMFESNFPVDKISFGYGVLFNAFKRVTRGYSASERASLFHDTAARVYRISDA